MSWKEYDVVTLEFTRIVIAVQVMAAGVSLPRYIGGREKRTAVLHESRNRRCLFGRLIRHERI
jgi:hypothetical protein